MEFIHQMLQVLEYDNASNFKLESGNDIFNLVNWLEDRKIRELDVDKRSCLRLEQNWNENFAHYLEKLNCPYPWNSEHPENCITWLLSYAISVVYEDVSELCEEIEETTHDFETMDIEENNLDVDAIGELIAVKRSVGERDEGDDLFDHLIF
jgi:hypothetical protein